MAAIKGRELRAYCTDRAQAGADELLGGRLAAATSPSLSAVHACHDVTAVPSSVEVLAGEPGTGIRKPRTCRHRRCMLA